MLSPFNTISPSIRNDRVEVFNDREKSLGFLAIVDAQVDYFLGKISSKHACSLYQFMLHPVSLYVVFEASVLCKVHVGNPRLVFALLPVCLGLEHTVEDVTRDPRHDVGRDPPRGRRG